MKVKEILKGTKGKLVACTITGVIVGNITGVALASPTSEDIKKIEEAPIVKAEVEKLKKENAKLNESLNQAKPWFEMKEEEKNKLAEEQKKIEEEKKAAEELAKKKEEAKKQSKIGERIIFERGNQGEFALTIDSVELTSERNQFADKIDNVVKIKYTVENISMEELDFFMENSGEFYDAEGIKCSSYPNSEGAGTYNIAQGKKAKGVEFIGVNGTPFLEMQLGGTIYKWDLNK